MRNIEIYTDGGCRPTNPGYGAYAFVVVEKGKILHEECTFHGEIESTNNIMELTAAIKALEWCEENNLENDLIYIYTDSQYVQQGITSWIHKWKKRNWKTNNNAPVANVDLWKKLDKLRKKLNVNFQWVRSHIGIPNNMRVDEMCTALLTETIEKMKANEDQIKTEEADQGGIQSISDGEYINKSENTENSEI